MIATCPDMARVPYRRSSCAPTRKGPILGRGERSSRGSRGQVGVVRTVSVATATLPSVASWAAECVYDLGDRRAPGATLDRVRASWLLYCEDRLYVPTEDERRVATRFLTDLGYRRGRWALPTVVDVLGTGRDTTAPRVSGYRGCGVRWPDLSRDTQPGLVFDPWSTDASVVEALTNLRDGGLVTGQTADAALADLLDLPVVDCQKCGFPTRNVATKRHLDCWEGDDE